MIEGLLAKLSEKQLAWLDALRSGKYPQTKNVLKNENGYCCLGVAAEILDSDCWTNGNTEIAKYAHGFLYTENQLAKDSKLLGVDGYIMELVDFNDQIELPFPKIADKLEEYWAKKYGVCENGA